MFKHLVDFSYKRNTKEAFGFYLAYLLLGLVIGGLAGSLFGQDFNSGVIAGAYSSAVMLFVVGGLILSKRERYKKFAFILLVFLSVLMSRFGDAILGLIPLAYLTTK